MITIGILILPRVLLRFSRLKQHVFVDKTTQVGESWKDVYGFSGGPTFFNTDDVLERRNQRMGFFCFTTTEPEEFQQKNSVHLVFVGIFQSKLVQVNWVGWFCELPRKQPPHPINWIFWLKFRTSKRSRITYC